MRAIILLVIFTMCSCTGVIYNDGIDKSYKDHFPIVVEGINQITRSYDLYDKDDRNEGAKHILVLQDSLYQLSAYTDSLKELALLKFNYGDSCLLIIPDRSMYSREPIRPKSNPCDKNEFTPVPEFNKLIPRFKYSDIDEFIDSYEFYILEMESGKFLDDKRLLYEIGLPEKWDNGYTKGFGINEARNEFLFWIDIW